MQNLLTHDHDIRAVQPKGGGVRLGSVRRCACRRTLTLPPNRPALRCGHYGRVTSREVVASVMALCLLEALSAPPPSLSLAPRPPRPRRSDAESGCSVVMSPRRPRTTGSGLIPHFLSTVYRWSPQLLNQHRRSIRIFVIYLTVSLSIIKNFF